MGADKLNELLNKLHLLMEGSKEFKNLLNDFISKNTHHAGLDVYIFCSSILKRSNAISLAFATLIQQKNYIAATTLPRVLADNAMRAYGLVLIGRTKPYFEAINTGKVNKLKDNHKNKLTDKYLHEAITKNSSHKEFSNKYNECCSYLHFSHQHSHQAITKLDIENSIAEFNISPINVESEWNEYLSITENSIYFVETTYDIINKILNDFH